MNRLQIESAELAYVVIGSGRPVLLLHGWAGDHRGIMAAAEPGFIAAGGELRRIYLDLPGMGQSPRLETGWGAVDLLPMLLAAMDRLAPGEPFALAGFSYGGYLARGLVRLAAERLTGLALVAPVMEADGEERDLPEPIKLRRLPDDAFTDPVATEFRSMLIEERADVLEGIERHFSPGFNAADHAFLNEFQKTGYALPDEREPLPRPFTKPTLIVTGRQDAMVGYATTLRQDRDYPRATIATLDGAGHALFFERSELFTTLFVDWLQRMEVERA